MIISKPYNRYFPIVIKTVIAIIIIFFPAFHISAAEKLNSEHEGVGIFVSKGMEGYKVDAVIRTSPAEGKIFPGDIVESIDGLFTSQRTPDEISKLLKKKAGSTIKLTIFRKGQRFTVSLISEKISVSPDKIIGKLPQNDENNESRDKSGKIHSFETSRRFFCKNITNAEKYETGTLFTIKLNGKEIGTAKLSQIYDYGAYFTQADGESLNQIDRSKYDIVFLKKPEYSRIMSDRVPEDEVQDSDKKCYECNAPLRRGIKVEGKLYCNRCARNLCDVCWCCSQWCDKGDGEKLYTNMFVCSECLDKVWQSDSLTSTLYNRVQFMMEKEWGVQLTASPNISTVNLRNEVLGFYNQHRDKIGVNKQLKFLGLMGTIAHEHAHAWQARKNPKLTNMVIIEGFATWVEYHFYKMLGHEDLGRLLVELKPDYYRQGFNTMYSIEQKYGFKYVFTLISTYKEEE